MIASRVSADAGSRGARRSTRSSRAIAGLGTIAFFGD